MAMKGIGSGNHPNTYKNLKRTDMMSPEERSEFARKGQKKSAEAHRHNKRILAEKHTMSDVLSLMLKNQITSNDAKKQILAKCPILMNEELTEEIIINAKLIQRAKGDDMVANTAYTILRDTIGQKPTDKQELTGTNGSPIDIVFQPYVKKD
jgi:hypothetical protein